MYTQLSQIKISIECTLLIYLYYFYIILRVFLIVKSCLNFLYFILRKSMFMFFYVNLPIANNSNNYNYIFNGVQKIVLPKIIP